MAEALPTSRQSRLRAQDEPARAGYPGFLKPFTRGLVAGVNVSFLAIVVTLVVLGLTLNHNQRAVARLLERILAVEEPTSAAAYEMEINVLEAGLGVLQYVDTGDPRHRERVKKGETDFQRFKAQFDRMTETEREKEFGREIDTLYERYRTVGHALMDTRDEQAALYAQVAKSFAQMDDILDNQIQVKIELGGVDAPDKFRESASVEADVAEAGTWLGNYLATSNESYRERTFDNLQEVRGHLAAFQKLRLSGEELGWAGKVEQIFNQTVAHIDRVLALRDLLRKNEVEYIELRNQIDEVLDEGIQALTRRDLAAAQTQAKATLLRLHQISLVLLVVSGLVCAVAAAVIIHRSVHLQREMKRRQASEAVRATLLDRLVSAQEEERSRISRELHDQMGQQLSAMILGIKFLQRPSALSPTEGSPDARELHKLQDIANGLIDEVHSLALKLRPAALDDLGLHGALTNHVEDWMERSGVAVDVYSELENHRLPWHIETTLYRVVQEALTNVLKHAQARTVSLVLKRLPDHVRLVIEDDGCGFEADKVMSASLSEGRLGLIGMKERVTLAGGSLEIESAPAQGTTVVACIPIGEETKKGEGA